MGERWAVYFAPPGGSELEQLANDWLGRDLAGRPRPRPPLPGFSSDCLDALTEAPRRYGFHATLKPPFPLVSDTDGAALRSAAEAFAADRAAFTAPALDVRAIGSFLALVPSAESPELSDLAAACVRAFEAFRAPQGADDIARRRAAGLTPRQDALLTQWGYPYVMEEFRFHMTLTGPVSDTAERTALQAALRERFAPACREPLWVSGIALYAQDERSRPFTLRAELPFGA